MWRLKSPAINSSCDMPENFPIRPVFPTVNLKTPGDLLRWRNHDFHFHSSRGGFYLPLWKQLWLALAIINFREIFTSQDSFPWSGIIAQKIKSIQKLPNLFHYFRLRAKYDFVKKGGIWQHEKIHSSDDLHTFEFFRRAFSSMIPFFQKKKPREIDFQLLNLNAIWKRYLDIFL